MTFLTHKVVSSVAHLTVRDAAEKLGVNGKSLRRAAVRLGVSFASARGERERAYAARTHLTAAAAAADMGVSAETVRKWARAYGITFRGQERYQRPNEVLEHEIYHLLPDHELPVFCAALDNGATVSRALEMLRIGRGTGATAALRVGRGVP